MTLEWICTTLRLPRVAAPLRALSVVLFHHRTALSRGIRSWRLAWRCASGRRARLRRSDSHAMHVAWQPARASVAASRARWLRSLNPRSGVQRRRRDGRPVRVPRRGLARLGHHGPRSRRPPRTGLSHAQVVAGRGRRLVAGVVRGLGRERARPGRHAREPLRRDWGVAVASRSRLASASARPSRSVSGTDDAARRLRDARRRCVVPAARALVGVVEHVHELVGPLNGHQVGRGLFRPDADTPRWGQSRASLPAWKLVKPSPQGECFAKRSHSRRPLRSRVLGALQRPAAEDALRLADRRPVCLLAIRIG
jgi:hypothetical protein